MDKCTLQRLSRRKVINFDDTALPRVLTLLDLTALGIGSTIGVGFYVLAGDVARSVAGPAVIISFLIAGIASLFAGLCYAEFGGRVPKAGSAYIYTYVCIGEFIAFVIGWNLILEYVIGTASIASGFSGYIDAFFDDAISKAMREAMPMNVSFLAEYPDFLAAGLCLLLAAVLAFGVKESSLMNNVVTIINLFVVVYVIITAATKANTDNWSLTPEEMNVTCNLTGPVEGGVNNGWGVGGFVPYGFGGIMQGAATCFYGFVGFDVIASTGEEALRPERNLPIAICLSLFVIFIAYFGMASFLTLAIPYCQQDASAPLIYLYEYFDMNTAKIIVSIGALFGFSASLFGAIFPMPRVIYAMASDGLLFRFLSVVNERFRSPIIATMVSGSFAAVMAMLFDLEVLVNMMSIGTLQAYTIVALCVMMLRYSLDPNASELQSLAPLKGMEGTMNVESQHFPFSSYMRQALNKDKLTKPDVLSTSFVAWATLIFCILCFVCTVLLVALAPQLKEADPASITVCVIFFLLGTLVIASISLQPQSDTKLSFMVPLVPWLPALSTFINLYLMCNLPPNTWIKFAIWMAIGLAIYFFYGVCFGPGALEQRRRSSKSEHAQDNLGFTRGSGDVELETLAIPTITVLPATPLTSAANTPHGTVVSEGATPPPRRHSHEVVVSALVAAELAENNLLQKDQELMDNEKLDEEVEGNSSSSSGRSDDEEVQDSPIQAKVDFVLGAAPLVMAALVSSSADDATHQEKLEQSLLEQLDNAIDGKSPPGTFDLNSGVGTKLEDGVDSETRASDSNVDNRSRPPPLTLKINEDTTSQQDSVLASSAVTESHSLVNKALSLDDIECTVRSDKDDVSVRAVSSSVPVTPTTARRNQNPSKSLKRMSSFDSIPPSSPDSPFATRINDFIVIPVQEPALSPDSDSDSDDERKGSDGKALSSSPSPLPGSVMLELKKKLDSVGSAEGDEVTTAPKNNERENGTGKTSSFEELKVGDKDGRWVTGLPEPIIVSPTRELRQNIKHSLELDTIRERGESRVLAFEDEPSFAGTGGAEAVAAASADKRADQPSKTAATSSKKNLERTDGKKSGSDDHSDTKISGHVESDDETNGDIKQSVTAKKESLAQPREQKDTQPSRGDKGESIKQETGDKALLLRKTQPPVKGSSEDKQPADSLKPFFDLGPSSSVESLSSTDVPLRPSTSEGTQEKASRLATSVVSVTSDADSADPKRLSVKDMSARFQASSSSSLEVEAAKPVVERPVSSIAQLRSKFQ